MAQWEGGMSENIVEFFKILEEESKMMTSPIGSENEERMSTQDVWKD
jgi:hypothetical protein